MKVLSTVLTSALLFSGCSQISEHFYSKRNFNSLRALWPYTKKYGRTR
jgi:PBP1b-binding outer membrane lipoprotein LpoB